MHVHVAHDKGSIYSNCYRYYCNPQDVRRWTQIQRNLRNGETCMAGCHLKCLIFRNKGDVLLPPFSKHFLEGKSSEPEIWGTEYWSAHFKSPLIRTGSSLLLLSSHCISVSYSNLQSTSPSPIHTHRAKSKTVNEESHSFHNMYARTHMRMHARGD